MAAFPTNIYVRGAEMQNPVVRDFGNTMAQDPAIRSQSEGGYVKTRARFTRVTRRWTVHYAGATQAGKDVIRVFENARLAGSEAFTWTNPEDSTIYTVRFFGLVEYTPWNNAGFTRWDINFILEQV